MSSAGSIGGGGLSGLSGMAGLRWLDRHSNDINRSLERLATGKRINRASDDPSGLIAVEKLSAEQIALERQIQGLERRGHRLAVLEGGLSVVSDLLDGLNDIVVRSANTGGTTAAEREGLQVEADSIIGTIAHLSQTSVFNGEYLLKGLIDKNLGGVWVKDEKLETKAGGRMVGVEGLRRGGEFDLINGDPEKAQQIVKNAVEAIASQRAGAGALMRSFENERDALSVQLENIAGAKSAILDTDYAAEVGALVRSQVMQQAAIYAITTARQISAASALALLG